MKTVNAAALVEMLRKAIEKNPNSGTYMIVDRETGCLLALSMNPELNVKISAWFHTQIQKGNAAGAIGQVPDAKKDTELQ